MESIRYSMWNPWNHCWLRPQPIYCSMDIMDSMWNDHGMVNSIWNPTLFHGTSPYGFHWNSIWKIPWYLLSKIVSSMRIEHSTLQHVRWMREHSNSCTKRPLKDNKMTLIYSVYHGHHPNRASAFADAWFGHQQTTTSFFLNHHHHHPRCPPIVATPPPTTNNHLDMPVHHPNNTGMPRQQPWPTTTMTHHNHNHNRWQPCHNNGRTTTHHPRMAPMATSTQHHLLTNDIEGPCH